MKRFLAAVTACLMLFMCSACGSQSDKEVCSIVANYSVKSENGEFVVEVQNLGGVYDELYDTNGIYIIFKGGSDEIYDKNSNKISRDDLSYGDSLEIQYDGTLNKENPKTIKAYKVIKMM